MTDLAVPLGDIEGTDHSVSKWRVGMSRQASIASCPAKAAAMSAINPNKESAISPNKEVVSSEERTPATSLSIQHGKPER